MARSVKREAEAVAASVKEGGLAANVEEAFLLAGKTRFGQVLGRGAGPHRHVGFGHAEALR